MYATPKPVLKKLLSSADLTELLAADRLGLIPDPWRQTGTIAAAVVNHGMRPWEQPARWDDFVPMVRSEQQRDLNCVYRRRKSAHGKGP